MGPKNFYGDCSSKNEFVASILGHPVIIDLIWFVRDAYQTLTKTLGIYAGLYLTRWRPGENIFIPF